MSVAEIQLEGAHLEEGESTRVVCPFCAGGSSKERSCNITAMDGGLLYNCHRASCLKRGATGDRRNFIRIKRDEPRKARITPYTEPLEALSQEWEEYLEQQIGWSEWHRSTGRAMYAPTDDRVAYPIYSPLGTRRGWVLRSYDPSERTKALTRMDVEEPHLSWYRKANTLHCVIVEDCPSAVRAARYADTVALCGGGLGLDYAMEIAAYYTRVVWALDADATGQAVRLCNKFRLMFELSHVQILQEDVKDMDEPSVARMFGT